MQRGGSPTCFDRVLASRLGLKAVETIASGVSSQMVGIIDGKMALTPLRKAIKGETSINPEMYRLSNILRL